MGCVKLQEIQIANKFVLLMVLGSDMKIPLTCQISCVGGIKGCTPVSQTEQCPQWKCCVSCIVGKQDIHLFPKVNRTPLPQWKCCMSCVWGAY